jgi:hypothetical protein
MARRPLPLPATSVASFSRTKECAALEKLIKLKKRLDFKDFPASWHVLTVSVDWAGEPLVLFDEGKPPQPSHDAGMDALLAWMRTPPLAHHLVYWDGHSTAHTQFGNPMGILGVSHVQPFAGGWLLGESRWGRARIFDRDGANLLRTLDLGDASEDVQTTSAGHTWVSYFDEGVFGDGIGQNGLVCFDANGHPIFRYADFATEHELPHIDDCYALNVCEGEVWVCYYSHFPFVCLRDFQLEGKWDWEPTQAFAIRSRRVVLSPAYRKPYLVSRSLDHSEEDVWRLADPDGNNPSHLIGPTTDEGRVPFSVAARGPRIYVWTEKALFEVL